MLQHQHGHETKNKINSKEQLKEKKETYLITINQEFFKIFNFFNKLITFFN
jgi:hypothetical protein